MNNKELQEVVDSILQAMLLMEERINKRFDAVNEKLEMMLEAGGLLDLGVAEFFANKGDYVYLKDADSRYIYQDGTEFRFKGAFNKHRFGKNMRNTPSYDSNSLTLCMTDFSNSEREVEIEF